MKVTRLWRGMRIRLTDPEYRALVLLVELGLANLETARAMAESASVRGHLRSQRWRSEAGPLRIDEDRRPEGYAAPAGP